MLSMLPLLITLMGERLEGETMFTAICGIVTAAVSNIVGDIKGLQNKTETTQTAVLNTLFPWIGGAVGKWIWPAKSTAPAPASDSEMFATLTTAQKEKELLVLAAAAAAVGGIVYYETRKA